MTARVKTEITMPDPESLTIVKVVNHWPNEWLASARCLASSHLRSGFLFDLLSDVME
jgi:hypothetical protein